MKEEGISELFPSSSKITLPVALAMQDGNDTRKHLSPPSTQRSLLLLKSKPNEKLNAET